MWLYGVVNCDSMRSKHFQEIFIGATPLSCWDVVLAQEVNVTLARPPPQWRLALECFFGHAARIFVGQEVDLVILAWVTWREHNRRRACRLIPLKHHLVSCSWKGLGRVCHFHSGWSSIAVQIRLSAILAAPPEPPHPPTAVMFQIPPVPPAAMFQIPPVLLAGEMTGTGEMTVVGASNLSNPRFARYYNLGPERTIRWNPNSRCR